MGLSKENMEAIRPLFQSPLNPFNGFTAGHGPLIQFSVPLNPNVSNGYYNNIINPSAVTEDLAPPEGLESEFPFENYVNPGDEFALLGPDSKISFPPK